MIQLKTPDELNGLYMGIAIVRYMILASVLIANGGILLAFLIQKWRWRHRRPRQRLHPSGCFVLNLLIVDTLAGAILLRTLPFKLWPENTVPLAKNQYACLLRFAIVFLILSGSQNALFGVIIDRYIAVVHTMQYKDWMTKRTCMSIVAALWVMPVTGCVYHTFFGNWQPGMPACNENLVMAKFSLYVWFPIHLMLFMGFVLIQCCVHFELRRSSRTKRVTSPMIERSAHKSARTMLISTVAYGVAYLPYDVAALVYEFFPSISTKLVYDLCAISASLSFLVNPCLYSFKTESVRRPVMELFNDIKNALPCVRNKSEETQASGSAAQEVFTVSGTNRSASVNTLTTSLSVVSLEM